MCEKMMNTLGEEVLPEVLREYTDNYPWMEVMLSDFLRWGTANGIYVSVSVLCRKYDLDFDDAALMKEALIESRAAVLLEDQFVGEFAITAEQAVKLIEMMHEDENKNVRNIGYLASPHEGGSFEAAVKILKKVVAKNAPVILGTYLCERSADNKVYIPIRELTAWAIVEDEGKRRVVLAHHKLMFDVLFPDSVIERGECEFGRGGAWKMPFWVTEQLASYSLVCIGMYQYAELLTVEEYDRINEREQRDIEDIMKKIEL